MFFLPSRGERVRVGAPSLKASAGFGEVERQRPPFLTFPPVRRGEGTGVFPPLKGGRVRLGAPSLKASAGFGEVERQRPPFLTFPPVRRGEGTGVFRNDSRNCMAAPGGMGPGHVSHLCVTISSPQWGQIRVSCCWRRCICSKKLDPSMPAGRAKKPMPRIAMSPAIIRPGTVTGATSP